MIKRNKKAEEKKKKLLGNESNIKIKLPFLLANISDKPKNQLLVHEFNSQRLELISNLPM